MRALDRVEFCGRALREQKLRAGLSVLGIAIGVAAVVLLTSIGDGVRRFVTGEFMQFGTNLLEVTPGKTETLGLPGVLGGTTHDLTLEDAEALRRVHGVEVVVPVVVGQARVAHEGLGRSVFVFGVTSDACELWKIPVRQGEFLPGGDPRRAAPVAVLGPRVERELFGGASAVGQRVRIAGRSLRVVGVLQPKGQLLGFDMDDCAYVPVAAAMGMFDTEGMHEIDVTFARSDLEASVVAGIRELLMRRHGGEEDFTVLTQAQMLAVFDEVLAVVKWGVVAIAAVSLLVGAVGILTVLWISVGERTPEIGLMRALGATMGQVRALFLIEATALAAVGGALGLAAGLGAARLLGALLPALPVSTPWTFAALALAVSMGSGLLSGLAPASRAARLDPVLALRDE